MEGLSNEFDLRQVTDDHFFAVETPSSGNTRHEGPFRAGKRDRFPLWRSGRTRWAWSGQGPAKAGRKRTLDGEHQCVMKGRSGKRSVYLSKSEYWAS